LTTSNIYIIGLISTKLYIVLIKIIFTVISLAFLAQAHAISIREIGNPSGTQTQDRFLNNDPTAGVLNPNFDYPNLDFSGVGWGGANGSNTATLIGTNYIITSDHNPVGSSVNFLTNTGVQTFNVVDEITINNPFLDGPDADTLTDIPGVSDLRIGILDNSFDAPALGLTIYPVLDPSVDITSIAESVVYGQRGRIGLSSFNQEGTIEVPGADGGFGFVSISTFDLASGGSQDSFFTSGDSGAPTFVVVDGELVLTGIHFAVGDNDDPTTPVNDPTQIFNVDTSVPFHIDQIESEVAAFNATQANPVPNLIITTAVPEPNSSFLILFSAVGLIFSRRRK